MNKLRSSIGTPTQQPPTPAAAAAAPTKIPTQRPASPPTQPVIQQREKSSTSDDFIISNESLVRPSAARRAERMVSASPVPRMMTSPVNHQVSSPINHQVSSPINHQMAQRDPHDPSAFLMNPQNQQQQQQHPGRMTQIDPRYSNENDNDLRPIDERGSFFNQPPVNFPSQNTKNSMDYFELQKLMYPASAPRQRRDVTPTSHFRSSSGAGLPNNVASDPQKGEVPIYDTYLRHETGKNRKQFGGGGTSEFASSNPVTPMNIVTDSRISDNPDKNFKSGGSVPNFVPKNYVAPPNFGSARKLRQGSDSGPAPTWASRKVKRSSSASGAPPSTAEGQDAPPPLQQPRRNLARQSKIERNLAKSFGVGGGRGGGGGGAGGAGGVRRSASVNVVDRPDSVASSRSVSMSPAPSLQQQRKQQQRPPQQQVKFNPESHVIYYDDYDTMTEDDDAFTEDEEDYELVFNDPMPNQQTGTYSYSFKHGQEEEEAEEIVKGKLTTSESRNDDDNDGDVDGNKFKTISPPTYGDDGVREVPMDREIPIQRPGSNGGDNRLMRNQQHHEGGVEEEDVDDAASEATSTSPNASPTRQIGKEDPDVSEIDVSSGEEEGEEKGEGGRG